MGNTPLGRKVNYFVNQSYAHVQFVTALLKTLKNDCFKLQSACLDVSLPQNIINPRTAFISHFMAYILRQLLTFQKYHTLTFDTRFDWREISEII